MVERVKISPSQIILRDGNGSEVFNTSNLYLKTDPSGILKAGGYQKSPSIYGQGTIVNHDNGWYTSSVISGTILHTGVTSGNPSLNISVPKCSDLKIEAWPLSATTQWTTNGPTQPYYFNGSLIGYFQWAGDYASTGPLDEYGNATYEPSVRINYITPLYPRNESGTYYFPPSSVAMDNWSGTRMIYPGKGNPYQVTDYFKNAYSYDDGYGSRVFYRNPRWRTVAVMPLNNPVSLSLAVTP